MNDNNETKNSVKINLFISFYNKMCLYNLVFLKNETIALKKKVLKKNK